MQTSYKYQVVSKRWLIFYLSLPCCDMLGKYTTCFPMVALMFSSVKWKGKTRSLYCSLGLFGVQRKLWQSRGSTRMARWITSHGCTMFIRVTYRSYTNLLGVTVLWWERQTLDLRIKQQHGSHQLLDFIWSESRSARQLAVIESPVWYRHYARSFQLLCNLSLTTTSWLCTINYLYFMGNKTSLFRSNLVKASQ